MNQKIKSFGLLLLAFVLLASPALGKGTADVTNTKHNMSTSRQLKFGNQYRSSNVDEVCVFCHTPHGGTLDGPLWNHSAPATSSFTHYNSAKLSSYLQGLSVSRVINDESLLCMACHDGSVAVNSLHNDPNSLNGNPVLLNGANPNVPIVGGFFGSPNARIGAVQGNSFATGDLSDDHPISFSYSSVFDEYAGTARDGDLRPVGDIGNSASALGWQGEGVRFFGVDNRVECSSCHDPHVDYETAGQESYDPFLIRPNTGSNLCLSCHNK